jgi:hypothetical protein
MISYLGLLTNLLVKSLVGSWFKNSRCQWWGSWSDDDLDANIALMVRKTTKMLKKLNREGIKFDSKRRNSFPAKESPFM